MDKIKGNKWSHLTAIGAMGDRLRYHGGAVQQDRMIADKRRSLDRAAQYSYQAAKVKFLDKNDIMPALINPNKLTNDYDDKIISIGYEYGFTSGDVFEWAGTGTKWLVLTQELTELAYFRADIRRCRYEASWKDENGNIHSTFFAVRGPVETDINFIQKNGISVDVPNHSLHILMPKNEHTLKYFKRYSKFYLQGLEDADVNTCWRVEGRDSISTPGILEITAVEYYANETEDDLENGVVGGLLVAPIKPEESLIIGETFIKPKILYEFMYTGKDGNVWTIDNMEKLPIEMINQGKVVKIKWLKTYSGQFTLRYGKSEKTIVIESLF